MPTYRRRGERISNLAAVVEVAAVYGLTRSDAKQVVERIVAVVETGWPEAAEAARLSRTERELLWGRMILNPGILADGLH